MAKTTPEQAEEIRQAILATETAGVITPAAVVEAAKADRRSALGQQFNWDRDSAAEAHWTETARRLIKRFVTVEVTILPRKVVTVQYVRHPDLPKREQGYIALTSEQIDLDRATKIMLNEIERCANAIDRARAVCAVLERRFPGVGARLDRSLHELTQLRGIIDAGSFGEAAE